MLLTSNTKSPSSSSAETTQQREEKSSTTSGSSSVLLFSATDPLIYPRIDSLDQIIENIGSTRGFVIQSSSNADSDDEESITTTTSSSNVIGTSGFTFVSYKVVASDTFPSIPLVQIQSSSSSNNNNSNNNSGVFINLNSIEEIQRRMLRREIRGLCFDRASKRLVCRSMPKFFNVDEREETNFKLIEQLLLELKRKTGKEKPFVLLEKLDGSLCTPVIEFVRKKRGEETKLNEVDQKKQFRLRFRTKLDYQNDHSQSIEEFVYQLDNLNLPEKEKSADLKKFHENRKKLHESRLPLFTIASVKDGRENELTRDIPFVLDFGNQSLKSQLNVEFDKSTNNLIQFCVEWMNKGYTPLFEYFSPQHRVVINYGNSPFLSVLALRHTILGNFIPYEEMIKSCQEFSIEHVKKCSNPSINSLSDVKSIKKSIEDEKFHEGYVLVLDNGSMFKIKSNWYLNIHKTNEMLQTESMREGRVWFMILDNKLDDVLPNVHSVEHKKRLEEFNDKVLYHLNRTVDHMMNLIQKIELVLRQEQKEEIRTEEEESFEKKEKQNLNAETSNQGKAGKKNGNNSSSASSALQFVQIAKQVCQHEKTSLFLNAILKCRNSLLTTVKSSSSTSNCFACFSSSSSSSTLVEKQEVASVLLDIFIGYMKPLLKKKIETVREVITYHVEGNDDGDGMSRNNDENSRFSYKTQEEAIKDLILFTNADANSNNSNNNNTNNANADTNTNGEDEQEDE